MRKLYVKVDNQGNARRYTLTDLKRDNPDTSFSAQPSDESLAGFDVYPLEPVDAPDVSNGQRLVESAPELVDGKWVQAWSLERVDLDERRAAMRAEINRRKIELQSNVAQTSFGPVDLDDRSQRYLMGAVLNANLAIMTADTEYEQVWTMADDIDVTLTAPEVVQMGQEVASFINACHATSRSLKVGLRGDHDDLDAIDVSAGWP